MGKIRKILIHWLGGVTEDESVESDNNSFFIGRLSAFDNAKEHADKLYGLPADEWCTKMYEYLERKSENPDER